MKLSWEQQQRLFHCDERGARYNPMIIRYYLSLYAKSSSSYEEIRNCGILRLTSSRTLRDNENFISSSVDFQDKINDDLRKLKQNYTELQRYIVLMFDEMKTKSN